MWLMMHRDGQWDWPLFKYSRAYDSMKKCVADFSNLLGLDPSLHCLTPLVGLMLGYASCAGPCSDDHSSSRDMSHSGEIMLLWLECHVENFVLPDGFAWKSFDFIRQLESPNNFDKFFGVAQKLTYEVLDEDESLMKELWQPHHQLGWHAKASKWLKECVQKSGAPVTGAVQQHRMNITSTILKVESDMGGYFLKAPTAGSDEIRTTRAIIKVMPQHTLKVVGISEELGCFVSQQMGLWPNESDKEMQLRSDAVKALAKMQLASVEVAEALIENGCKRLGLDELVHEMDNTWVMENERLSDEFWAAMETMIESYPAVKARLELLKQYNIPMALTHGDFSRRNVEFLGNEKGDEKVILFDWQYSAVSHPFFDFCEFHAKLDEKLPNEYLLQWSAYEPLERAKECFEIARPLGFLLRAYVQAKCVCASRPQGDSPFSEQLQF